MAGAPRSSSVGARAAVVLGAALVVVAGVFDAEPLWVPAVAFLVLGLGCLAWVATGARGLRVGRSPVAPRVVEGDALDARIVVQGTRAGLPSCEVLDPLLEGPAPVRGGRREATVPVEARFAGRGRRVLPAPVVVVRDPLGLARRVIEGEGGHEVLVLPRIEPVRSPGGGEGGGSAGRRARVGVAPAAEVDVDGLRPHREGAPASRIHWPAFARSGQLLERRLRAEGDSRPLVLLDPRGGDPEGLDAAVRAAASLCVHLARQGGCALLLPGDRRPAPLEPGLAGWPHLHARLAVVDAGGRPALGGVATRRGALLYVAARALGRIPSALAHAPGASRFLVVPGRIPGRAAAFEVAGCSGYDLASTRTVAA